MARLKNTFWIPNGGLGDWVLCNGKNRSPYVRSRPRTQKPRTPAQERNSLKLKVMELFLSSFRDLINQVWKEYSKKKIPYDCARSWFYHNSFIQNSETVQIRYEEVKLSRGTLPSPLWVKANIEGKILQVRWEIQKSRSAFDFSSVCLAIHNEATSTSMYNETLALAKDEQLSVILPEGFLSGTLHAYLIFLSPDRKNASPTQYIKLT